MQWIRYIVALLLFILLAFLLQQWWENSQHTASEKLFVYGTLKNPLIRFYACRCHTEATRHNLPGYYSEDRDIYKNPNQTVSGYIFSVTPIELARFDTYENTPKKYKRIEIKIEQETVWLYKRTDHKQ